MRSKSGIILTRNYATADSQPPFDVDAYMQGRQDLALTGNGSTLSGNGSCTAAAVSADINQISQLDSQLPALNCNGLTLNCDTSKMI